jgi:hypothetical protein
MKRTYLLALVLAGCASAASEKVAAILPPGLAATWLGLSSDGPTYYRLDLDDEGTGSCAIAKGAQTTLYRARWSERDELVVHLEVVDGPPDAARLLELRGRARASELTLAVEGRHSLTLWRERDLLAAREKLAARMGAGPRSPP